MQAIFQSVLTLNITFGAFILCLVTSLAMGFAIAFSYMKTSKRYTNSFVVTLALLPAVVQIVIMLVNGNLGAGVAVAGAFSLVRFRSIPGTAKEIGYIFIFGSVLPMYLLYVGSENLTATHTAVYRYIQPIIATIVATARGQAIIDRTNIVGAVLIFIGMLCVILFTPRSKSLTRV